MINYLRVTYIVSQILIWYETKKSLNDFRHVYFNSNVPNYFKGMV